MRISISGPAAALNEADEEITNPSVLKQFSGTKSEDSCIHYLDESLSDIGLIGGELEFVFDSEKDRLQIQTVYHSPRKLKPTELKRLVAETCAQWSDGIGEGEFGNDEISLSAAPTVAEADDVAVEQIDDGIKVPRPRKSPLFNAAKKGDVSKVEKLLEQGEAVDVRDKDRSTPLLEAVMENQIAVVQILVNAKSELNVGNRHGFTPVGQAATHGNTEVLEILLAAGADPNYCDPNDYAEHPPLHMACNRGHFQAVKLLVEHGANINYQCKNGGYSAIMHLNSSHLDIAKYLVANGANTELKNLFDAGIDEDLKEALSESS